MATTYTLISSNVLSSSAASVTFSSIPSTYTDLVLRISAANDAVARALIVTFNSTSSGYSRTIIYPSGGAVGSANYSNQANLTIIYSNGDDQANSFGNVEIYIPSYGVSQNKPINAFGVAETNTTNKYIGATAGLWQNTAAITSITITPNASANFVSDSTFYLYGIKNS